jgi:hypothetical protein
MPLGQSQSQSQSQSLRPQPQPYPTGGPPRMSTVPTSNWTQAGGSSSPWVQGSGNAQQQATALRPAGGWVGSGVSSPEPGWTNGSSGWQYTGPTTRNFARAGPNLNPANSSVGLPPPGSVLPNYSRGAVHGQGAMTRSAVTEDSVNFQNYGGGGGGGSAGGSQSWRGR